MTKYFMDTSKFEDPNSVDSLRWDKLHVQVTRIQINIVGRQLNYQCRKKSCIINIKNLTVRVLRHQWPRRLLGDQTRAVLLLRPGSFGFAAQTLHRGLHYALPAWLRETTSPVYERPITVGRYDRTHGFHITGQK